MKAMILAAGEGTRLRPFTLHLPKPAIPFLGIPLADYGIRLLAELGPCDLVVNHHHLSDEIHRLFHRPQLEDRRVEFSDERQSLLGSGGAVHHAAPFLRDEKNFVLMNGDEVILPHFEGQLRQAWDEHLKSDRLATLLVIRHPGVGTQFGGAWTDSDQSVKCFSKTPVEGLIGWHYIGIAFFSNRIFSHFKNSVVEENLLYETLIAGMAQNEEVKVSPLQAEWFETGNPQDFREATDHCLDEMLKDQPALWARDLMQFLKSQEPLESLVESEDLMLMQKLSRLRTRLKGM